MFFIFFYILVLLNSKLLSEVNKTSATQLTNYPSFAYKVAFDNQLFNNFRNEKSCIEVVETVNYELGLKFEKIIKDNYSNLLSKLDYISLQDSLGNPIRYNFSIGYFSPTTLRYIKIAGDIISFYKNIHKMSIVEIGGGYGGQCKIINDISGFSNYTIIDLPECSHLINKYLNYFNIKNFKTVSNSNVEQIKSDLIISNYAIAEISRDEQIIYIDKILNHALFGYIIYNYNDSPIKPFTLKEFVKKINIKNRKIIVLREIPITGPNNYLIIWHPENYENHKVKEIICD